MGEKMSLQQVRDALLDGELYIATGGHDGKLLGQSAMLRLANAIDAHLTQPAQAVDAAAMAVQNLIDREHHKGRRATAHVIREVLRAHLTAALPKKPSSP